MKVECTNIVNPITDAQADHSNWITIGKHYVVLSTIAVPNKEISLRLICDDGYSIGIFSSMQFRTVCSRLPSSWIALIDDQGVVRLTPEKWGNHGFWEDYFSGDPSAIEDFEIEKEKILLEANEVS